MISTATVRERPRRVGALMWIMQGPVDHARGTAGRRRYPHCRGCDVVISTATVREPGQRIGEWTRVAQRLVAHARGTERDRIGSVKGHDDHGASAARRAAYAMVLDES